MRAVALHVLLGVFAVTFFQASLTFADGPTLSMVDRPSFQICPVDVTCEERCGSHARALFQKCLDAGHDRDACGERARAVSEVCVEDNCKPQPRCESHCRKRAMHALRRCVSAGYDREACKERAHAVYEICVEENCRPKPTCEEKCRAHSRELLKSCLDAGHPEFECGTRAREAFEKCVDENCALCLCPHVYEPVCGVDGKTYGNACEAGCAGVEIDDEGPCESSCECNGDCPAGEVCRKGRCEPPCQILCFAPDPVCGSDGRTYACGEADAACHGVTVLHEGPCAPTCREDADCRRGSVCAPAPDCNDPCGCASFCTPVPEPCDCPDVIQPVCGGLQHLSFKNPCQARCAGVELVNEGLCP